MTTRRDDHRFEAGLREGLREVTNELPPGVAERLATARTKALAAVPPVGPRWRIPALAASVATLGVIAVLVWDRGAPLEPELLELAEREEMELADDLEFYLWLDQLTREG